MCRRMNENLLLCSHFLNVVIRALSYYIEHTDINDPLEREYCTAALNIRKKYSDALREQRKRKLNKFYKFRIK